MKPVLSICIATYGRGAFIAETLDSLVGQLTDGVEIVVLDGASPDETPEVLARYAAIYPAIRFVRLETNRGFDRQYCAVVSHARGEYCWLYTDDDIARPGVVAAVLAEIERGRDLIVINAEVRNRDLSRVLRPRMLPREEDRAFEPHEFEDFFRYTAQYLTFVGAIVIRRDLWASRETEPYLDTDFVHVGVVFQKPFERSIAVIGRPYIVIRYGNALWRSRAFRVWMIQWPAVVWSFSHLSPEARAAVVRRQPWRRVGELLRLRAVGVYGHEEYRDVVARGSPGVILKAAALAMTKVPQSAAALAMVGLAFVLHRGDKLAFFDYVERLKQSFKQSFKRPL